MKIALALHKLGINSSLMHGLGLGSIAFALALWGRSAAMSDEKEKGRAERLAIFVGLWPPTFIELGKIMQDLEHTPEQQYRQAHGMEEELTRRAETAGVS